MKLDKPIPMVDLAYQHNIIKDGFQKRLDKLFTDFDLVLGEAVREFEEEFARWTGTEYCITTSSGTSALELVYKALSYHNMPAHVIIPTNTFHATASACRWSGLFPYFVDCGDDYLIDLDQIKPDNFKGKIGMVCVVHLYGQMIDMQKAKKICDDNGWLLIEDAAQAHGACYFDEKGWEITPGELSEACCYSFFPGKNLGSLAGGGAVTTNNKELADKLRKMKWFGCEEKNVHEIPGTNSKLDTIEAIYLLEKMKYIDEWNHQRREIATRYAINLASMPNIILPIRKTGHNHVFHQFVIRIPDRELLIEDYRDQISFGVHYPTPCHKQDSFTKHASNSYLPCPNAEQFANEVVSLPIHPGLSMDKVDFISQQVIKHCRKFL